MWIYTYIVFIRCITSIPYLWDRISSGYSQSCVGHTNRLSAAALLAAYSSAVTGALIEHLRRAAIAGLTGYTTAMKVA